MKKDGVTESAVLNETTLVELLVDCSIDAIIAIDINYRIITWNKKAAAIYNVSNKKAIGKSLREIIPGLEHDQEMIAAIDTAIKGYKSFVPASKLHPHRLHSENHFIPLKDAEGTRIGIMNIVHDVSHRIKAERQLQRLNEELKKRLRQLEVTSAETASFTYITSNKIKEPIRLIYTG